MLIEIRRKAYEALKTSGFSHNGTIFGGFVRDEYIAEYHSAKFNREYHDTTKYWDIEHMPDTKARLLIPSDMDISFRNDEDADDFIHSVKEIKEFKEVYVSDITHRDNQYSDMVSVLKSIRHLIIVMRVGHIPFKKNGVVISICVDVIVPNNPALQPPFNNLDMLCNGFIMTKDGGKQFSRNTGTIIDKYSDYERAVVVPQIINDIHKFKTYICMTSSYRNRRCVNVDALRRVRKMLVKKIPWTMLNMPYKTEIYKGPVDNSEKQDCSICFDALEDGQEIAYTTLVKEDDQTEIPAGKLHCRCMMQYLHSQTQNLCNTEGDNVFTFKCPFRNKITFTRCKLDIQFAYKTTL
jgi:hypothetical protein